MNTLKSLPAADQQLVIDYLNALARTTGWTAQLGQVLLPPLSEPPPGYADFAEHLVTAKEGALDWSESILPQATQLPDALLTANALVERQLGAATRALSSLGEQPGDTSLLSALRDALSYLAAELTSSTVAVQSLTTTLAEFPGNITNYAGTLSGFAAIAAAAEGANAASVAQLTGAISQFQQAISTQNEILLIEKLANWDLSIFLTIAGAGIGLMFPPAAGVVIGTLFGIATGAAVSFFPTSEVVNPTLLAADQTTITQINSEIEQLNSQVALLVSTADAFSAISNAEAPVAQDVATVASFWQTLVGAVSAASVSAKTAQAALTGPDLAAVASAVAACEEAWLVAQHWAGAIAGVKVALPAKPVMAPLAPQGP